MNLLPLTAMPAPALADLTAARVIDAALAEELLLLEEFAAPLASLKLDALQAASVQSNAQ